MKNQIFIFLIFILIGTIIGGIVGELLSGIIPILNYGRTIGVAPFTIDLAIVKVTLGFQMALNLAGIIGLLLSLVLYRLLVR